jgi:hypothetical protein
MTCFFPEMVHFVSPPTLWEAALKQALYEPLGSGRPLGHWHMVEETEAKRANFLYEKFYCEIA